MKRFFLYNALMTSLAMLLILFYRKEGYMVSLIMRQDVIYYTVVFNFFLIITIFGIAYQMFAIKWRAFKRNDWFKVLSIVTTIYLGLVLIFSTRIHLTFSIEAEIMVVVAPILPIGITATFNKS